MNSCTTTRTCESLSKRISIGESPNRGGHFRANYTVNIDSDEDERFLGVSYHLNAKDKGLMLNWCPFCGEQPGYFRRNLERKP